ncbi:malate dehydrogenase, chloroplastic-like [Nicotiana sylvestris]|uniref:malate dehydrogenase, chloroplastic-like n=1 Tax=Nicotiana sylvestris TaxID=4096 RepID=UPI00388C933F
MLYNPVLQRIEEIDVTYLFAVDEMAAASATTFSVGSATSFGSTKSQSKAFVAKYNTRNYLRNFSGLKAEAFVRCESESSFLGRESAAALRQSIPPKAQIEKQRCFNHVQPQASYKVAILGAAGGIGQSLALLIKMSPLV